jgi:hypothetical protein
MSLLLKFKTTTTASGVSRETLKAIAEELGMNETATVHLAISKLGKEVLPNYEADEGPLSAEYQTWLQKKANEQMPNGKPRFTKSLI